MINVVSHPSARELFYINSFTENKPSIWYLNQDQNLLSLHARSTNLRRVYLWDLHYLSDVVGEGDKAIKTMPYYDTAWHPMWVESFEDNAGSDIVSKAPVGFTVSIANLINALGYTYRGKFTFSPLIPAQSFTPSYFSPVSSLQYAGSTDTWFSEMAIYNLMLFPALPFTLSSTIPNHNMYGPVFCNNITLTVSGDNALAPVKISVSFEGGRSLINNNMPYVDQRTYVTPQSKLIELPNTLYTNSLTFQPYRTATISDCEIDFNADYTDVNDFLSQMFWNSNADERKITYMELNISQNVEMVAVSSHATDVIRDDTYGPKFAEIKNRKVTGKIRFTTRKGNRDTEIFDDINEISLTTPLTMYFGGPFYFPMQNVDWNEPIFTINPDNTWTHEYSFSAKAANDALTQGFYQEALGYPISEFNIPSIFDSQTNNEGNNSINTLLPIPVEQP